MAGGGSQLKRLKTSLKAAGVTGQQQSKKAKKKTQFSRESRVDRRDALTAIREQFNPFELKKTNTKFDVIGQKKVKGKEGRPALSKQVGEENRKKTLLKEMHMRNKAGGIVDRRFGENDPTMDLETRMMERFTRERTKRSKGDIFNLEDDDEDLEHFGASLGKTRILGTGPAADDFEMGGLGEGSSDDEPRLTRKRRLSDDEGNSEQEGEPERKKSKAEVMKEVIAKSKLHKYERQKAKDDDEELREKLDAGMGDLWALLGAKQPSTTNKPGTGANDEPLPSAEEVKARKEQEAADGEEDEEQKLEKEYDQAVREMLFDRRSKPSERTKTDEEKAAEESERLKRLEEARQRRMRGEESEEEDVPEQQQGEGEEEEYLGEAAAYGLGTGIPTTRRLPANTNPDEHVDGDYVAEDIYAQSDDDASALDGYESDSSAGDEAASELAEDSDEEAFLTDIKPAKSVEAGSHDAVVLSLGNSGGEADKLSFTFPCPQTHTEMLEIVKDIPIEDLPTVVQRIRILHHPKLEAGNKAKLAQFSTVLLSHILYISDLTCPKINFSVVDTLIRHLHAMTKTHPVAVSNAFREHLKTIHEIRTKGDLTAGDLVLFTAIGTIFSTSDHFHAVVTPAMIVMCKWLEQVVPSSPRRLATGAYLATLCARYQRLSKRFIPEAIDYVLAALYLLAPEQQSPIPGRFLVHDTTESLRLPKESSSWNPRKLGFPDIFTDDVADRPTALIYTFISLLSVFADQWAGKQAFIEVFTPALSILSHYAKTCKANLPPPLLAHANSNIKALKAALALAASSRKPLELHHHRPLPIASNIPKFEEEYSMDKKSYDRDNDRRELAKLKAQHKKEKKGAIRELRKDSAFIGREQLRQGKKESKEYHEKIRRAIAMVQTEEGAEANRYKRERNRK